MPKKWTMRKYKEGDEVRIIDYQNRGMRPEDRRSLDYWHWEYAHNPTGIKTIWIAEDNDLLVGHYALMPLGMKVGSRILPGAQSVDTFTHHNYRRLGIFVALATKVYDLAGNNGISVLYGFPSIAAYHGFVKRLQWIKVSSIDIMLRPLSKLSLILQILTQAKTKNIKGIFSLIFYYLFDKFLRRKKPILHSGLKVKRIKRFHEILDKLWAEIELEDRIRVVKNQEYMNWRYIEKPGNSYSAFQVEDGNTIIGYIVIENKLSAGTYLKKGLILDILCKSNGLHMRQLLKIGAIILNQRGADTILFWTVTGSQDQDLLRSEGFAPIGERILIARSNLPTVNIRELSNPYHWHIVAGDVDTN